MALRQPATAFLDTNVFLHGQPFDQINWPQLLKASSVKLRVPLTVIRELNRKKDEHPVEHVKDRARTMLARLNAIVKGKAALLSGCELQLEKAQPPMEFAGCMLDPARSDEVILASVLHHREQHPDERVVLVTWDEGFDLQAHVFDIETFALPENFRLPPAPDARQRQIAELKKEVTELRRPLPKLAAVLPNPISATGFVLRKVPPRTLEDARAFVESTITPTYPVWKAPPELAEIKGLKPEENGLEQSAYQFVARLSDVWGENAERNRTAYLEAYAKYKQAVWKYEATMGRIAALFVFVHNSGGAPAEEVRLFLALSPRVRVRQELPVAPQPPVRPGYQSPAATEPAKAHPVGPGALPPCTLVSQHTRPTGTLLAFHHPCVPQHLHVPSPPIYLEFPQDWDEARLLIEWRIIAMNVPDQANGEVVVPLTRVEVTVGG